MFLFKDAIKNLGSALMFSMGKTYGVDDWIKIKGEIARIKHIGWRNTSFFMVDDLSIRYVRNEKIKDLEIRKAPKGNPFELQKISSWYRDLDKETLDKMIEAYKKENGE